MIVMVCCWFFRMMTFGASSQRAAAMEPESEFMERCHTAQNFQPSAGDYTRLAATNLMRNFPKNEKWKMFRGVNIYLCDYSEESNTPM
jgi:hypothetical protein